MIQAINMAMDEEMGRDETVVALGQDIGLNGGVFRATDGLYKKYGEDRVIDTPLAESGIMGTSIGMAVAGLRPVAEIQFSGFAYLILGQLEGHAARLRPRTHGVLTCPLVVRMPYGGGVRALEHHSESKEATYAHIPGIKVVIPSNPTNARALLTAAIRDPDPVIFMEPKRSYRAFREEVTEEMVAMEIGKSQVVQEGDDVTVISWGAMMRPTKQAVEELGPRRGISIELIDLLTISPLDADTITSSVQKTGRCVVVQEAHKSFGPASEIIATINDKALMHLEAPVRRVSGYDLMMPYFGRENAYMPGTCQICKAVEDTADF
jgi:pyruvate dehydrogenase E1 component beta subunit